MTTETQKPAATITELRRLLAASPWCAPWVAHTFEIDCPCPNGEDCGDTHTCEHIEAPDAYPDGQCVVQISVPGLERFSAPTGQLIAAMRNALPALLDEAEAAARMRDTLRLLVSTGTDGATSCNNSMHNEEVLRERHPELFGDDS